MGKLGCRTAPHVRLAAGRPRGGRPDLPSTPNEQETQLHRLRLVTPKAALWLAATVVALSLPLAAPTLGHAEGIEGVANYNSEECSGHLKAGTAENEVEEGTAIQYSFACNGPITGYQIESQ